MADAMTLIAEALLWPALDSAQKWRVLARLDECVEGQFLLHELALGIMARAEGEHDEGGRRLALHIFQQIAQAKEALARERS